MFWVLVTIDIILLFWMIKAWRHVSGLRGGYGKGTWSENSGYMLIAKSTRFEVTVLFILFIILTDLWTKL